MAIKGEPHRNKIEQKEIEKIVYELLMGGYSYKRIIDTLMENYGYNTEVNCYKVIEKVVKSFKPKVMQEIDDLKDRYLEMHTDLYKRALETGDVRAANDVLKSITKLQGLDVQKIEIKDTTFDVEF